MTSCAAPAAAVSPAPVPTASQSMRRRKRTPTAISNEASAVAEGATPLMYACQQARKNDVKEILKNNPDSIRDRDRTLKTALHYCAEAPGSVAAAIADILLTVAPDLLNAGDEDGYTPLHLAVIAGSRALIKLLLARGADANSLDNEKHSVVHWATVCGEVEALELVLEAGALASTPDIHGGYPVHYAAQMCGPHSEMGPTAARHGLAVLRKLLHSGVGVNVTDRDGRQPILWAASAGSADAILALVNAGANVEAEDKDGLTALHCAASRGHTDCLETLISLCGAEADVLDGNGCTALFYAVTLGHADATRLLLSLGARPDRQDRRGRTPAHCGASKGQLETLRILSAHGANIWMKNVRGDLPLHEAVASGRKELVRWLLSQRPETINAANNDGRCPLHVAALHDSVEMCKILLDNEALVNPVMRTSKGQMMTPLDAALHRGNRGCAKYLQVHGGVPAGRLTGRTAKLRGVAQTRGAISETHSEAFTSPDPYLHLHGGGASNASTSPAPPSNIDHIIHLGGPIGGERRSESRSLQVRVNDDVAIRHVERIDPPIPAVVCHHHHHYREPTNFATSGEDDIDDLRFRRSRRQRHRHDLYSSEDERLPTPPRPKAAKSRQRRRRAYEQVKSEEDVASNWHTYHREKKRNEYSKEKDESESDEEEDENEDEKNSSKSEISEEQKKIKTKSNKKLENEKKKRSKSEEKKQMLGKDERIIENSDDKHKKNKKRSKSEDKKQAMKNYEESEMKHKEKKKRNKSSEKNNKEETIEEEIIDIPKKKLSKSGEKKHVKRKSEEKDKLSVDMEKEIIKISEGEVQKNSLISMQEDEEDKDDRHMIDESEENMKSSQENEEENEQKEEIIEKDQQDEREEIEKNKSEHLLLSEYRASGSISLDEEGGTQTLVTAQIHREDTEEKKEEINNIKNDEQKNLKLEKEEIEKDEDINATTTTSEYTSEETSSPRVDEEDASPKVDEEDASPRVDEEDASPRVDEEDASKSEENEVKDREESKVEITEIIDETDTKKQEEKLTSEMKDENEKSEEKDINSEGEEEEKFESKDEEEEETKSDESDSKFEKKDEELIGEEMKNEETEKEDSELKTGQEEKLKDEEEEKKEIKSKETADDLSSREIDVFGEEINDLKNWEEFDMEEKSTNAGDEQMEEITSDLDEGKEGKGQIRAESEESTTQNEGSSQMLDSGFEPSPRRTTTRTESESAKNTPKMSRKKISRPCRKSDDEEENQEDNKDQPDISTVSVTQAVQNSMRKYHLERRIFHELLELKRLQIRAGRANEQVLVKRLVDDYRRAGLVVGLTPFEGTYTFRSFEKYLYDQLRLLQSSEKQIVPRLKSSDDLEKLTKALRRARYNGYLNDDLPPDNPIFCTFGTHRCQHATHAYTGIPCAAYIGKLNHHQMPKDDDQLPAQRAQRVNNSSATNQGEGEGFLPKIHRTTNKNSSLRYVDPRRPVTLELSNGMDRQLISLPTDRLDKNKRYYVTFTVKSGNGGSGGGGRAKKSSHSRETNSL